MKPRRLILLCLALALPARAEVLLQYFETQWDEIYQRLPEIAEIGYEGLWVPPPTKSPHAGGQFAGGGNVGYSGFDRFDLGDVPQRGSLATRYGTRGALRNLVDNAHACDIKVYPDIVFNHSGNGPDYRTYPGTSPNDYHGWFDGGQPGGYRRASRMSNYGEINNGYGRTFQEELVSLIDLQLEADNRFSTGAPNFATKPSYFRQPGWAEYYPFGYDTNEDTIAFMKRWINWLGYAMDFDGVRLDAPKHCIADFLGLPGSGFLHEVQWNFQNRRGYSTPDEYSDLYKNYIHRKNALIFGEFFIGSVGEVDYWRNFGGQGVKLRYLDFPRKSGMIFPAFNSGDLGSLAGFSGFSDAEGIVFCQSHDESPPSKLELAYAYILTHVGLPVVYFTGNNLSGSDVNVKTWLKIGHGAALGDYNNSAIPNLVYINNQFARGREWNRWTESDFYVYERYDDLNSNASPDTTEGLLLVGLNDSGNSQTRNNVQTAFASGTVLHDYTGHNLTDLTVNGSGQVNLTIPPGNNGQGWVCYAPYNATANGAPIRFNNSAAPTMNWVIPGGTLTTNKFRQVARVTNDVVDIDVYFNNPSGGTVDNVLVKWGQGLKVNNSATYLTNNTLVSGGFQQATDLGGNHWRLTATLTNVPEGLHLIKARVFNTRPGGYPALFQTFQTPVYVDRTGPALNIIHPPASATVDGDIVAVITNTDRTASSIEVRVDGGDYASATEFTKGLWKFALTNLTAGSHTIDVRAFESDWNNPRSIINTSVVSRTFTVDTAGPTVSLSFANINNGTRPANIELPFFTTTISATGGSTLKLYWDDFELPVTGSANVFDGRYIRGGVTNRLYGAFINGAHFLEAVAINGGLTNRAVRKVTFNLYGTNQTDSDGDGLPDDVEMPNFSQGTAPGPNIPWPGDTSGSGNQDMIPNYGEYWTRLNPMNADTTYNGTWDGDEDWDGDSFNNLCEVRQGYLDHDNAYWNNIYNSGSKPTACTGSAINPVASWSPTNPNRCGGSVLTITYAPNAGPLNGQSPIQIHIGYNNYTSVADIDMTPIGNGQWQYAYSIPGNATNVDFVFRNTSGSIYDNNSGADWHVPVTACLVFTNYFTMDGNFDNANYEVANAGMKILAAVKSNHLYAATWSGRGGANDHILYVTDKFALPQATPWAKAGNVFFDATKKPWLAVEQSSGAGYFSNGGLIGRNWIGNSGFAQEFEIDMDEVFGYTPEVVYIAAVAYGTGDGGTIVSQCPPTWINNTNSLTQTEFVPVPIASIRDENKDGVFDAGKPQMWTVVAGITNDANYNLRRYFLDESMGESNSLTVILQPNIAGVSNVELFSNLNRRDFAVLPGDEDPATVTTTSPSTYYRAYTMSSIGGGQYAVTLPVNRCGSYRLNARYTVAGKTYYYTDNGLRRDCAVVVSPRKALNVRLYELNPMIAEATNDTFYGRSTFSDLIAPTAGRPGVINTNYFKNLGVNMLWLQPIHPIGSDNRQTDPSTGGPFDPGSPYAVRNYWQVNSVLGNPATTTQAMNEFTNFVAAMQSAGVGTMLDCTLNHSAWDCEVGTVAQQMFPGWATSATGYIRDLRPQWYSKTGNHGEHASYYLNSVNTDIAIAPDRFDFGKWSDVADFNYGNYDTLVTTQTDDQRDNYLSERDRMQPLDTYHREVWQYFSYYPLYWLEKTGCPAGTPKSQQPNVGIAGLRCDFAQGLPSQFWEYTINKTRSRKWDFIFMAESLDGYKPVAGNLRHGLSYRSARQFDVLNENLLFLWRDTFFSYYNYPAANPTTSPIFTAFDTRRTAYDTSPLLLNLTTHDEIVPHDDQWRVLYAYAILGAMDGVPQLFTGQEAGLQNDATTYTGRGISAANNYARHETNFGKSIPNFKRYNHLTSIWNGLGASWKTPLNEAYQRINKARAGSIALRSQQVYFLNKQTGGGFDPDIFAVAKLVQPGIPCYSQDVVFVFVNNNYSNSANRTQTYALNATAPNGQNWFGINSSHSYNIVDLMSTNPTTQIWSPDKTGSDLINNGIGVWLHENPYAGQQAQYLRLIDKSVSPVNYNSDGIPDALNLDKDADGLPDSWETANSLSPSSATGDDGANGDKDRDGMTNLQEYLAGTNPNDGTSVFKITHIGLLNGTADIDWTAVPGKNYAVEASTNLVGSLWQQIYFGTAQSALEGITEQTPTNSPQRFYRARVLP